MSEILQTNIFFIITSVAVLVLTVLVCIILYQVIKIIRSVRKIVNRLEEGSQTIAEDASQLREYVVEGGLVSQIMSFFMGKKMRKTSRPKKQPDEVISK